jgi:hypothetical protein
MRFRGTIFGFQLIATASGERRRKEATCEGTQTARHDHKMMGDGMCALDIFHWMMNWFC